MVTKSTFRTALEQRYQVLQECRKYVILPSAAGSLTPYQKDFISRAGDQYKVSYPGKNA